MTSRRVVAAGLCLWVGLCVQAAGAPKAPAGKAGDLHARITDAYMQGRWDELGKALGAAKDIPGLTEEQKADVQYVREALAECRPAWWTQCKQGKKTRIYQLLWGKKLAAFYEPDDESGLRLSPGPWGSTLTVHWSPASMDSTDSGKYGFQKGDMNCVNVWGNLGMGLIWSKIPQKTLAAMSESEKLRFQRFMSFRSNLTTLYHSTPPGRRYALHIYFAAFLDQYATGPLYNARRAATAMLLTDVLANPGKYPSLRLPNRLPADNAEKALGSHFKFAIKRTADWTIPEDRAYRQALKAFAEANNETVFRTDKVTLPNKLVYHLDPEQDAPFRLQRDAWVKDRFEEARATE